MLLRMFMQIACRHKLLQIGSSRVCEMNNIMLRCSSTSTSLPGGFNSDGLREYAMLTNFGTDDQSTLTGQEIRRRRRLFPDDERKHPYVDLFSKKVSDNASNYIIAKSQTHFPSDVLGRAFFGSSNFMGEKMVLSSLNSLFSLYHVDAATTLPKEFRVKDQFLLWQVVVKSPFELILSYEIETLKFRGLTMLAFDPSLRKVYHGNCIDVREERIQKGFFPKKGVQLHVAYAKFLLDGMTDELENLANKTLIKT